MAAVGVAVAAGCAGHGPSGPEGIGGLVIDIVTSGVPGVPIGLTAVVEGNPYPVDFNGRLALSGFQPGRYSVELLGVPSRCSIDGASARKVDVQAGSTSTVLFRVTCQCLTALDDKVFFVRRGRRYEFQGIYAIDPSTLTRLFLGGNIDSGGAVGSPRGDAFAYDECFFEWTGCRYTVRIVNACGENVAMIDEVFDPTWSPDGAYLAFGAGGSSFRVVRAYGSTVVQRDGAMGAWSPDGTRIAYTSADGDIWTMDFDGTNPVNLTNDPTPRRDLSWSPDGSKIAFTLTEPDTTAFGDIYTVSSDGSSIACLRCDAADEGFAVWSPDGSKLAFLRANCAIMVAGPDGTNPIAVASIATQAPVWSPDASRLAFTCLHDSTNNVCVVNADGSGLMFLSQDSASEYLTAWGPRGGYLSRHQSMPIGRYGSHCRSAG
jgi:TolB protein